MAMSGLSQNRGTLIGFDFGTVRIGVAVGELETRMSQPHSVITGEANALRFAAIEKLIAEWQPVAFVVGLPAAPDGTPHDMTARCQRFGQQLHGRYRLPVHWVDERWSSTEADEMLRELKLDARERRQNVDALAAQRILQNYLDALPS